MASQAPNMLPLLYNGLEPLNRNLHGNFKVRRLSGLDRVATTHAMPVTVDEFAMAQRHYPDRLFGRRQSGADRADGPARGHQHLLRRRRALRSSRTSTCRPICAAIPFVLARLREDSDELSLCFDPTSGAVGEFDEGEPLFDGEEPSEATKAILQFCEQFEQAGQRTQAFMNELKESGLLMDGEVAIQPEGAEQPFIYRGFQMVDEEKFRNLRGDKLSKLNQNGALPLIMAHLFSLSVIREIFGAPGAAGHRPDPVRSRPRRGVSRCTLACPGQAARVDRCGGPFRRALKRRGAPTSGKPRRFRLLPLQRSERHAPSGAFLPDFRPSRRMPGGRFLFGGLAQACGRAAPRRALSPSASISSAMRSNPAPARAAVAVEIERPVDFQLQRVDAPRPAGHAGRRSRRRHRDR